jgi:hypothetical protein
MGEPMVTISPKVPEKRRRRRGNLFSSATAACRLRNQENRYFRAYITDL